MLKFFALTGGLGTVVVTLFLAGGLSFVEAFLVRTLRAGAIEHVVRDYFGERLDNRNDAALGRLTPSLRQQRGEAFEAALRGNPLNFADVHVHFDPEASRAHTAAVEIDKLLLRRAHTGCEEWSGKFKLRKTGGWWIVGGAWRIDAVPSQTWPSGRKCGPEAVQQSWAAGESGNRGIADDRDSLPEWAKGRLQRVDPIDIDATTSAPATQSVSWSPRNTVDYEEAATDGDEPRPTSWKSSVETATPIALTYTLPREIRLARIRVMNGVLPWKDFWETGRVDRATIVGGSDTSPSEVAIDFPGQTPNLTTFDCDYGTTRKVVIRIDEIVRDHPDVALREVQFWGVPAEQPVPAVAATQEITATKEDETHQRWAACHVSG